jgi:hypothetical protein
MSKDPNNRSTERKGGTVKEIAADNSTGLTPLEANHTALPSPMAACASALSPKPFLPQLLQPVLLKGTVVSEKLLIGTTLRVALEFDVDKLKRTDVVCNLEKPVVSGTRVLVNNGVLRQDIFDCIVNCFGHDALSIIVIHFYGFILFEIFEVVEQEFGQVAFHSQQELGWIVVKVSLFVCEREIREWHVVSEDAKAREISLSVGNRKTLVIILAVHKWSQVHGDVCHVPIGQIPFVKEYDIRDVEVLVMKYEGYQIEARRFASIARLVNENRYFPHDSASRNKNTGGNPPAHGGRPFREDQCFYTTNQGAFSRCNYTEHTFVSQYINPGKSIRKAA